MKMRNNEEVRVRESKWGNEIKCEKKKTRRKEAERRGSKENERWKINVEVYEEEKERSS